MLLWSWRPPQTHTMGAVKRLLEKCVTTAVKVTKAASLPSEGEFAGRAVVKAHGEGLVMTT